MFPERVRVLALGGGIHGVGVVHDLASRGWRDVALVEKSTVAAGTSSRSTKLIHGGLRYLQNLRDFPLVSDALKERLLLTKLAPDLVHPLQFLFPVMKKGGMPGFVIQTGLTLYDLLAGKSKFAPHASVSLEQASTLCPPIDSELFRKFFSFWDGQMDDLALAQRVGASAQSLGAKIFEHSTVESLAPSDDGWNVTVRTAAGGRHVISALYVVNCLGPWANALLERSGITPTHQAFNNKGIHLVVEDLGLKAGLFLQSPEDGRVFFVLPWQGKTLVGTTEDNFTGDPDNVFAEDKEIKYLLEHCNRYLSRKIRPADIITTFAGLRWLPLERGRSMSRTSRSHVIGMHAGKRGSLMTIYGGKYTTYRSLARELGDRITRNFGEFRPSQTDDPQKWVRSHSGIYNTPGPVERFAHENILENAAKKQSAAQA